MSINALELNPNNLTEDLEGKEGDKQVVSMLLVGNYLGALRIIYFYKWKNCKRKRDAETEEKVCSKLDNIMEYVHKLVLIMDY